MKYILSDIPHKKVLQINKLVSLVKIPEKRTVCHAVSAPLKGGTSSLWPREIFEGLISKVNKEITDLEPDRVLLSREVEAGWAFGCLEEEESTWVLSLRVLL